MSRRNQTYWDEFDTALDKALDIKKTGHFDWARPKWFLEQAGMNPSMIPPVLGNKQLSMQAMAEGRYYKIMEFRSLF